MTHLATLEYFKEVEDWITGAHLRIAGLFLSILQFVMGSYSCVFSWNWKKKQTNKQDRPV